jgi:Family of unknown function (DUF6295)
MCTGLVQRAKVSGAGKSPDGWFELDEVSVTYDCSYHTTMPQGVNIDFLNEAKGPGARVAVELDPRSAMELVHAIMESLHSAGIDPGEVALGMVPAGTTAAAAARGVSPGVSRGPHTTASADKSAVREVTPS